MANYIIFLKSIFYDYNIFSSTCWICRTYILFSMHDCMIDRLYDRSKTWTRSLCILWLGCLFGSGGHRQEVLEREGNFLEFPRFLEKTNNQLQRSLSWKTRFLVWELLQWQCWAVNFKIPCMHIILCMNQNFYARRKRFWVKRVSEMNSTPQKTSLHRVSACLLQLWKMCEPL